LSKLNFNNNHLESGFENFDDCAIYPINDKQSIIQTVDFFTPIVDDPYSFGQIAATNALSDIYAMGGKPLFALNIVAFPTDKISHEILSDILKGGQDKCHEAKINILGGHSIKDDVPKYGLAVTGLINSKNVLRNNTPFKNDSILLTKPLGTGIITTAIKKGLCENSILENAVDLMSTLNLDISSISHKINACTDVTGYGLLGHLNEMCSNNSLSANINYNNIPFINGVEIFAKKDIIPGGSINNYNYYKSSIGFDNSLKEYQKLMLADAQTSGGLLLSVANEYLNDILDFLNTNNTYKTQVIGKFVSQKNNNIIINNE
tara:strand:+ start:82 stop:1038 length:957 start_codon:yes stop_codon:yes gene_type:complete